MKVTRDDTENGQAVLHIEVEEDRVERHLQRAHQKVSARVNIPGFRKGKAPRRTWGVMQKYLNPWAAEVIARHPQITVCDQWQYVKENEANLYEEWWSGKNVHFGGMQADALGQFLARHVEKVTAGKK